MTVTKQTVYFTMVLHPLNGWTRVGNAYASRESARSWLGVVGTYWLGCKVRVSRYTVRLVDGKLDKRSAKVISEKFNLDPPEVCGE